MQDIGNSTVLVVLLTFCFYSVGIHHTEYGIPRNKLGIPCSVWYPQLEPLKFELKQAQIEQVWYAQLKQAKIEHASFTPLVMSATGGLAHEATCFYKRLASLSSHKWGMSIHL